MLIGVSFLLGLMMGSFANVCAYRLPEGLSVVRPRSFCPSCRNPIAAYDNIPVVSFLLLGGKCRFCRQPISWRYPMVEILSGLGYAAVAWSYRGPGLGILPLWGFVTASLVIAAIDLDRMIIPDVITIPGILVGLVCGSFLLPAGPTGAFAGAVVGGGLLALVGWISKGGMGGGDVKYMAMAGSLLGWEKTLAALLLGVISGAVIGVFLLVTGKKSRKDRIPFGPFLVLGSIVSLVIGDALILWYLGG